MVRFHTLVFQSNIPLLRAELNEIRISSISKLRRETASSPCDRLYPFLGTGQDQNVRGRDTHAVLRAFAALVCSALYKPGHSGITSRRRPSDTLGSV